MRKFCCLLCLAIFLPVHAEELTVPEAIEKGKVYVEAFDRTGKFLRAGLGFVWDQGTVICSYSNVKGASTIKLAAGETRNYSNRLISYSRPFDLAVLKAEEEIGEAIPLGSSDMLSAGDSIYYFLRKKGKWQLLGGVVKGWIDSGKGYELIRLQLAEEVAESADPSPLYNGAGKVVGWLNRGSIALPLEAVGNIVGEKSVTVSLAEMSDGSGVWAPRKVKEREIPDKQWEMPEMSRQEGTRLFPFRVDMPRYWKIERVTIGERFLLRAVDDEFGVCVELRILPAASDGLILAIEQAEARIFPGLNRSHLIPYSADPITGFRAEYEDLENGYSTSIFYTISRQKFYALSISYPQKYKELVLPLIE